MVPDEHDRDSRGDADQPPVWLTTGACLVSPRSGGYLVFRLRRHQASPSQYLWRPGTRDRGTNLQAWSRSLRSTAGDTGAHRMSARHFGPN
jgi:hypothetical protein